jgi:hypothetical protein
MKRLSIQYPAIRIDVPMTPKIASEMREIVGQDQANEVALQLLFDHLAIMAIFLQRLAERRRVILSHAI